MKCIGGGGGAGPALRSQVTPTSPLFVLQPYLKSWSQDLGVPILSVDYSLAPEAPFPRALEECFYAYCWALRNHHLLGTPPLMGSY